MKKKLLEAFNFSNEIQLTVIELVNKILSIMDRKDLKPTILNEVKGEIKHQYLSAVKAKEMLEWCPIYGFEEGLRETVEWYKQFFKDSIMEAGNHD